MPEFISEPIEVQAGDNLTAPASFVWQGRNFRVLAVVESWQDHGFGATHPVARNWRTRRHRNYYRVRAEDGRLYELYLDRGAGQRRWYLYRCLE